MLTRYLYTLCALMCMALPAFAQERVTVEVWVFHIERLKVLPAGHHHFVPVPPEIGAQRLPSGDQVLCESFEGAISLGRRLWEGMNPHQATRDIARAHGGRAVCGTLSQEVLLQPLEVAIRSHDGVHWVYVVKARDQDGQIHFGAKPAH